MTQPCGTISRVRGSVVDVHFQGCLPGLYHELATEPEGCMIEVRAHLDDHTVRGIALTTEGLSRGAPVRDTGHLLRVPVGEQTLGRALNVLGEPLDGKPPLTDQDVEWRPVQHPPLPLSEYTTSREIFATAVWAAAWLMRLKTWNSRSTRCSRHQLPGALVSAAHPAGLQKCLRRPPPHP